MKREVIFTVKRRFLGDKYTVGTFYINNVRYCDTLEDTNRDYDKNGDLLGEHEEKIYGETAIPYGTYDIELTYSPKFKRNLPLIKNVKHFEGIRIHSGSHAGHTDGCILLGENKIKGGLINSRLFVDRFINWMEIEKSLETTFKLQII